MCFPSQAPITNWFNDDFRSEHPGGEKFVIGDISVRLVTGSIELVVYQGMSIRGGQEVVWGRDQRRNMIEL